MKCCFPTVAQCRNRGPSLEATWERAPVKPLPVQIWHAIKTANDAVSDTTCELTDSVPAGVLGDVKVR